MALLVIFDVPARAPRRRLQALLARLGFRRIFPNTYERDTPPPGPRELERACARELRGQVYRLRIYALASRTTMLERWGR